MKLLNMIFAVICTICLVSCIVNRLVFPAIVNGVAVFLNLLALTMYKD